MADQGIHIGTVASVTPAKRTLRVKIEEKPVPAALQTQWAQVTYRDGRTMRCRLRAVRMDGAAALLEFVPGVTRENIAGMKGASVRLELSDSTRPEPAEFDAAAVIGFDVRVKSNSIGSVSDILATPAHRILEIETHDRRRLLVPAIREVIESVEMNDHVIRLRDLAPYAVDDGPAGTS